MKRIRERSERRGSAVTAAALLTAFGCGACGLRRTDERRVGASVDYVHDESGIVGAQPKGLSAVNAPMRVTYGTGSSAPPTRPRRSRASGVPDHSAGAQPWAEHHHQGRPCPPADAPGEHQCPSRLVQPLRQPTTDRLRRPQVLPGRLGDHSPRRDLHLDAPVRRTRDLHHGALRLLRQGLHEPGLGRAGRFGVREHRRHLTRFTLRSRT